MALDEALDYIAKDSVEVRLLAFIHGAGLRPVAVVGDWLTARYTRGR
jgi:hypothetical protein